MSFVYHIDVQCDQCGAVLPYAAKSLGARRALAPAAILHARDAGWTHSTWRDLCPQCRPRPRNRLHHRKDVSHDSAHV